MSSRVFPPGGRQASPMVWRDVRAGAPSGPQAATAGGEDGEARLAQMESQYQQKVREAYAAGAREGEETGRKRAAAELRPAIERLARSVDELAGHRARLRREAEGDVVQLALAIARRILVRELSVDPDALHGLIVAALEKLQGQELARVRVHPSHVSMLKSCLAQRVSSEPLEVVADPTCEPGGIVFETSRGNLDASVAAQLQEIERGLADRLRRAS